jgi:hypothetical protein
MISLKEFLEVIDYSVTEGWQYQWRCFGDNAYALDHHDPDRSKNSFTIIFDKQDKTVYVAEVHDYENNRSYRLMNPAFAQAYKDESAEKGVKDVAWDDVAYTDLETNEDWLNKAQAIFDGDEYDTRVSIPLDIPDDELFKYMIAAHERDMTFNQFVEEALRYAIDEHNRNPEAFKEKYVSN